MPRKVLLLLLLLTAGCRSARPVEQRLEEHVAAIAPLRATREIVPCAAELPGDAAAPADLAGLWQLALANNPSLRESAGDVEMALGRAQQARLYPNPQFHYVQDTLGSPLAKQGNVAIDLSQEIVTAGKRRLDIDVARQEATVASIALLGQKFTVLTQLRRAWYDYQNLLLASRVADEAVATLQRGVEVARDIVKGGTRSETDVFRMEGLLEQFRIRQSRIRFDLEAAWREVALAASVPHLPMPAGTVGPLVAAGWEYEAVLGRVLEENTALQQANATVERNRLALARARAEAVPNVTVGGGFDWDNVDQTRGASISVSTPVPLWDRKQGLIREAAARLAQSQAAQRDLALQLQRQLAQAWARYLGARREVERLEGQVIPRFERSLEGIRKGLAAGSAQVNFNDLFSTEQELNSTRLTLADSRRELWQAIADLQGLMQLDIEEPLRSDTMVPCRDSIPPQGADHDHP
jgi:cobalt-zinc-cadmium efflux system outer membrane protein